MKSKTLIMCHLNGQWIPFVDIEHCIAYMQKFKTDFGVELDKVRAFEAVFTEIKLDLSN